MTAADQSLHRHSPHTTATWIVRSMFQYHVFNQINLSRAIKQSDYLFFKICNPSVHFEMYLRRSRDTEIRLDTNLISALHFQGHFLIMDWSGELQKPWKQFPLPECSTQEPNCFENMILVKGKKRFPNFYILTFFSVRGLGYNKSFWGGHTFIIPFNHRDFFIII